MDPVFNWSCLPSREAGWLTLSSSGRKGCTKVDSNSSTFPSHKISPEFKLHCSSPPTQPPGIIYLMQIGKLNRSEIWNMMETNFCRRPNSPLPMQNDWLEIQKLLITNPISPFSLQLTGTSWEPVLEIWPKFAVSNQTNIRFSPQNSLCCKLKLMLKLGLEENTNWDLCDWPGWLSDQHSQAGFWR